MIKDVCKKYLIYVVSLKSQKPDCVGVKIFLKILGLFDIGFYGPVFI